MKKSSQVLIVTHVPVEHLGRVQQAVWEAGAGKQGNYKNCSFIMKGTGFFTPTAWAKPAIWEVGKAEEIDEYHLEFTCERDKLEQVMTALKKAHPYEEVPIQIFEYLEI